MCKQFLSIANKKAITHRIETFQGKEYIVAPAVLLNVGVHPGSIGPLLYTANELEKTVKSWNNKPVVLYHPGGDGSAAHPEILESSACGFVMNASFSDNALRADLYIDSARLQELDQTTHQDIINNKAIEISTGLFSQPIIANGEHEGEEYIGQMIDGQPDHLALLPGLVGACSIKKGCGLLVNESSGVDNSKRGVYRFQASEKAAETLTKIGIPVLLENELSFSEKGDKLHRALRLKLGSAWDGWIDEIYESYLIYRDGSRLFVMYYSDSDSDVELSSTDPVEVKRETRFVFADGSVLNEATKEEDSEMANKADTITSLISNEQVQFGEDDREFLETLNDDQLQKLFPVTNENADSKETKNDGQGTAVQNSATASTPVLNCNGNNGNAVQNTQLSYDDWMNAAPPEVREIVNNARATTDAEKQRLIDIITNSAQNEFTPEYLKTQKLDVLKGMAKLAQQPVQNSAPSVLYNGQGGGPVPTHNQDTVPESVKMDDINWADEFAHQG